MKSLLLVAALAVPAATAFACPGKATAANADDSTEDATHADADATRCAKNADLVGTNCSYSTGMMAQRVNADGQDVSLTAKLERTTENLPSKVAAPYTASDYHVIANEIVDGLDPAKKLNLTGKTLEVDGVKYFLVTGFEPVNS
jgi:hypothetical protein